MFQSHYLKRTENPPSLYCIASEYCLVGISKLFKVKKIRINIKYYRISVLCQNLCTLFQY